MTIFLMILAAHLVIGAAIYTIGLQRQLELLPDHPEVGFSIAALVGYTLIGLFAAIAAYDRLKVVLKLRSDLDQERRQKQAKLLHGPDELDDLAACCRIKMAIQEEINRSEDTLAIPPKDLAMDRYIREYMPEFIGSDQAEVFTKRLNDRLSRLQRALTVTQERIDRLQKEAAEQAHIAKAKAEERARIDRVAIGMVYQFLAEQDSEADQPAMQMTVGEAVALLEKKAVFRYKRPDSQYRANEFSTAAAAATALTNPCGSIQVDPQRAITAIADWLAKDIGAPNTAVALSNYSDLKEAGDCLSHQLAEATQLLNLLEVSRAKVRSEKGDTASPEPDEEACPDNGFRHLAASRALPE